MVSMNLGKVRACISPNAKEVPLPSTKSDILASELMKEIIVIYAMRFDLCEPIFFIHIDSEKDESTHGNISGCAVGRCI